MIALTKTLTMASILSISTGVFAEPGKIVIGGKVTQSVSADNITNVGIGSTIVADQTLASVRGKIRIDGDVHQSISAKNITNVAIGSKVKARQTIASVSSY